MPNEVPANQRSSQTETDADFWKREWERFESDKAIVDVDVRGWLYSPHRGPMNRKNRLLVGLARQLSGISAPKKDGSKSRESSPSPEHLSLRRKHEEHEARRDQERIEREAAEILKKGQGEGAIAAQGGYSEDPTYDSDSESIYGNRGRRDSRQSDKSDAEPPGPGHLKPSASWNQPADMTPSEMAAANSNLMTRLMPFLTNPLISTPITIFFYDSKTSQSKTVMTNEAGHFNIRAALDFVPTHIRVLASESLSAVEEVKIMEPKGVSIISDVDDTIKHSSIGSGAREIFRNAFLRDLKDLSIDGVKEWYNTMYEMGAGVHYVSNSPWQLFPVLVSYFQVAGLPPGSYHLKQYSGMLQGIFEPVAERKKGTLERIMRDFPQRKFILIGDSGEADLEVYTDVVLANPGRVIGVYIRDVTTPKNQEFFDSAFSVRPPSRQSTVTARGRMGDIRSSHVSDSPDDAASRPKLPARIMTETKPQTSSGPAMGKLIDLDDEPEHIHESHSRVLPRSNSDLEQLDSWRAKGDAVLPGKTKSPPPIRPNKPMSLRSTTVGELPTRKPVPGAAGRGNAPPPPPPRGGRASESSLYGPGHPLSQTQNASEVNNTEEGYIAAARHKVANAYNSIPPASSYLPGITPSQPSISTRPLPPEATKPVPPPRRGAGERATSYASNRLSWAKRTDSAGSSDNEDNLNYDSGASTPASAPINKKVDLWRRRWQRAKEILDKQGVELRSWRVGSDVAHEAVTLVEKNLRQMGVEGYGANGTGTGKSGDGGGEHKVKDLKN